MRDELVFNERQRINKWMVLSLLGLIDGLLIYGCIVQIGMGKPWGNNPTDNVALIVLTVILFLLNLSFFLVRLDTIINEDGVYERMFPFQLKPRFFPWDQILDACVIKMNPIKAFNSWGVRTKLFRVQIGSTQIRYGIDYASYTISGKIVLQLTLKNSKKIYVGTQRPEDLSEFLEKLDAKRKKE